MTDTVPASPPVPDAVAARYADWTFGVAYQAVPQAITYRLVDASGETRYLKIAQVTWTPSPEEEAERMRWAARYTQVPEVLEAGHDQEVSWLVTRAMRGHDASWEGFRSGPEALVVHLARGLRRFHEIPVAACPFDFTLDAALALARQRLANGQIDPERDFHREHAHLGAAGAVETLERTRPTSEDLVVCHGDYCLPNVLLEGGRVTGYLDLGELGVADRWWDLSVASWSVTWNLGPGLEDLFLDAYGARRDNGRLAFFRLLYDVVS